ncbi:hypothetical protein ACC764_27525 [Rhizobium ruizarguesonis]|jgi:hypothetical protein
MKYIARFTGSRLSRPSDYLLAEVRGQIKDHRKIQDLARQFIEMAAGEDRLLRG